MTQAVATIRLGEETRLLRHGEPLLVGRGDSAGLLVGRAPIDRRVSRQHVRLSLAGGLVTVTRLSTSQLVSVSTETRILVLEEAGEALTLRGRFWVLIPRTPEEGEHPVDHHYRLEVCAPGAEASVAAYDSRSTGSTMKRPTLSARDRRVLVAYARPMLRPGMSSENRKPASHKEAKEILNYSYERVRDLIEEVRKRLEQDGYPVGPDKASLVHWAVQARVVTAEDIDVV